MQDWQIVYKRLMADFKGERLLVHLLILGGFIAVGIVVEMFYRSGFQLMFVIWILGFLVDLLIFKRELIDLFTKNKPYLMEGVILKKVKKLVTEKGEEFEEFYFDIDVREAYIISKQGKSDKQYYEKKGEQRIEVPYSMFLSLKSGQEVSLVCEPDDYVWGLVRGDEVINIEE